ncbi:hypothetical protein IFM89_013815 [Coptis chinensis]|uniref:Uncharacterized protein n=1 Tax=Coptis chinensis TaxID=261450 RepID=A0A835LMB5_9MAGN|nr:hypothetical protein IFM89_013815 [Coptis chinensis]
MKAFGPSGHGVPFSSSSNLSPLAPPFTVDPSFPGPRPNSWGQHDPYFVDPYYGFATRPPHDNWQHINPPTSMPNSFPTPNLSPTGSSSVGVNPSCPTGFSPVTAYGQPVTDFYAPQSIGRSPQPYYPSASVPDSSTTSDRGGNSLWGKGGFWREMSVGEQWKGKDTYVGAPPSYASLFNQGILATDGLPACEQPSNVWVGKSVESLEGKHDAVSKGILDCTLSSVSDENSWDDPFNKSRTSVSSPASPHEWPYQQAQSSDFLMDSWSQLNPSTTSYGGYFTGFDLNRPDPSCFYPASSKSCVDQIYEPPSITSSSTKLMNRTTSSNVTPIERPRDTFDRRGTSGRHNASKTGCIQMNGQDCEVYGDTSRNKSGLEGDHTCVEPLLIKKIVPSQHNLSICVDTLKHLSSGKNKEQLTDLDLPGTFVTAETGAGDPVERSSEVLEQVNPAVDSPCWKGASDSRYSLFGAAEAETRHVPAKISEGSNSNKLQGHEVLPVSSDKVMAFSSMELQQNEKDYGEDVLSPFLKQPSPVVSLSSGQNGVNNFKLGLDHLQTSNYNVIQCSIPSNSDWGSVACNLNGDSDLKLSQTMKFMYHKGNTTSSQHIHEDKIADPEVDVKDAHYLRTSRVPCHGNDHYSSLPSLSSNVPIDVDLTEPLVGALNTLSGCQLSRTNVQAVLSGMHNLSKLVHSYCSKDEEALNEKDHMVIQQVVENLSKCLPRVDTMTLMSKPQLFQLETSNCSIKQNGVYESIAGNKTQPTNTEVNDVHSRCNIPNESEGKKRSSLSGIEGDKFRLYSCPRDDSQFEQDGMIKGIKKILEENFHDEEEADLQSLLYKNLWLEAEAALCSIKYKVRFAHLKSEMEKSKQHPKVEPIDVEKLLSTKVTPGELFDEEKLPNSEITFGEPLHISIERARLKTEMEKYKQHSSKEVAGEPIDVEEQPSPKVTLGEPFDEEKLPSSEVIFREPIHVNIGHNSNTMVGSRSKERESFGASIQDGNQSGNTSPVEDVNASVMARFRILKARIENTNPINKEGKIHDLVAVGACGGNFDTSSNICKGNAEDIVIDQQQSDVVGFARKNPWAFIRDGSEVKDVSDMDHYYIYGKGKPRSNLDVSEQQELLDFGGIQSATSNVLVDKLSAGESGSPSSEWEHVLKEATWPV